MGYYKVSKVICHIRIDLLNWCCMLLLTYDRAVKDLVYLYKALYGYIEIDITFVKRVNHG